MGTLVANMSFFFFYGSISFSGESEDKFRFGQRVRGWRSKETCDFDVSRFGIER